MREIEEIKKRSRSNKAKVKKTDERRVRWNDLKIFLYCLGTHLYIQNSRLKAPRNRASSNSQKLSKAFDVDNMVRNRCRSRRERPMRKIGRER